ncbi:MAG: type III-B CRISPR-associated protein Cas10/Cmr2 [Cyanobacteriota bacterium]|nr:type III-B CRISPR-associated protein Cas10/Cmr2 [Cyanobacteriota bacterium]
MNIYWQAKIWGLLHDPILKALHTNAGRGGEGAWESLACMEGWVSPKSNDKSSSPLCGEWLKHIGLCDLLASASDRAAIGRVKTNVDYDDSGIEIKHLLSGEPLQLKLGQWHDRLMEQQNRREWLSWVEEISIPPEIRQCEDPRKVFWWLWRCYGEEISKALNRDRHIPEEPGLPLLPADTRIPDASLWSHVTMTSALAGALTGYQRDDGAYPKKGATVNKDYYKSRPHVAIFSFTPVQELIKASRKMRDFWAGSWILHYLSAKVAWAIAKKYGPDTLLYPCLYQQPLIDLWLLEEYPDFNEWMEKPEDRQLLTAGFPNVLVIILPDNGDSSRKAKVKNPVKAAMQFAEQTLREEWLKLGENVLNYLQDANWMPDINPKTWGDWLECQWQTYWTALPLGDAEAELHQSPRIDGKKEKEEAYKNWEKAQNNFARPPEDLLVQAEYEFVQAVIKNLEGEYVSNRQPNLNVGSWWGSIFDRTKFGLNAVKNCRNWQLPTAFGPRSTISGLGPVVRPISHNNKKDWATEGETRETWSRNMGLFDGIEELNATEVVKRGLHKILPDILTDINRSEWYYPDLTSGVAGWLRQMEKEGNEEAITYYQNACQGIIDKFKWIQNSEQPKWGIPWIHENKGDTWNHPRLLNAGWAIEDFNANDDKTPEEIKDKLGELRESISGYFAPGNNPTDWYAIAAGDGDGMGEWLKGKPLDNYEHYICEALKPQLNRLRGDIKEAFEKFLKLKKRMGPSTHSALSRALLDFSNQLLPYLTEDRYAGRLIYGGGDDVLAYTNLWEWDSWLWDVRQCFKGGKDSKDEFDNSGDYWRWKDEEKFLPKNLSNRPLFTMGSKATISFGIVLAHHSVPLAIALENMWEAEEEAKEHKYVNGKKKDAVQVRVIYGNGNVLKATAKFDVFQQWKELIIGDLESAIFEQAATVWGQHPAPIELAIKPWTKAFCSRRDFFKDDEVKRDKFAEKLGSFIGDLWNTTEPGNKLDNEVQNWLKLAAYVIRNREIKI